MQLVAAFEAARAKVSSRRLFGLLVVTVAATIVMLAWRPGGTAHNDSAYYISGARNLADGNGFVTPPSHWGAQPVAIASYAPAFSFLTSLALRAGLDEENALALVLGLSFVVCCAGVYWLVASNLPQRHWYWGLFATALFALTPSVLTLTDAVLSDIPFSAVLIVCTLLAVRFAHQQRTPVQACVLGSSLAMAVLTRWIGWSVAGGVMAALLIHLWKGYSFKEAVKSLWLVGVTLGLPVIAWLTRNQILRGTLTGTRQIRFRDPVKNLYDGIHGIVAWLSDLVSLVDGQKLTVLFFAAWLVCVGLLFRAAMATLRTSRPEFFIPAVAAGSYAFALLMTANVIRFDDLTASRFWIPAWVLLVPLCAIALHTHFQSMWLPRWSRLGQLILLGLMSWSVVVEAQDLEHRLPRAGKGSHLKASNVRKAATRFGKLDCHKVVFDRRPLLVQGVKAMSLDSKRALDAAMNAPGRLCVFSDRSFLSKKKSARQYLKQLQKRRHLRRKYDADNYVVWVSR